MHHTIELWRWCLTDPESGRCSVTRYLMTEADARQVDPEAERVEGSLERREVPDDPMQISTSGWQRDRP